MASVPRIPVCGIGASAGGLEALQQFFEAVPADLGFGVRHRRAPTQAFAPISPFARTDCVRNARGRGRAFRSCLRGTRSSAVRYNPRTATYHTVIGRRRFLACALVGALGRGLTLALHAAGVPASRELDESDRAAFRAWFTLLADAQFERRTDDVIDCASLVRHAYREALRPHSPAWFQSAKLPRLMSFPDVRQSPATENGVLLLFKVGEPGRFAEFADAETIIRWNTRRIGRDARSAQPGDLLYFRHEDADSPSHVMVFVGPSTFDRDRHDWLVYHTGPDGQSRGEVRKVSLADLERHPSPRWRPIAANREFAGVYRLAILDKSR